MNLALFEINTKYTTYLYKFDKKVSMEHDGAYLRKFIGILFKINEIEYFAPLSSPKPKHKKLKSSALDIYKLENGKFGIINFNNMIPVASHMAKRIELIEIKDTSYKDLLQNQLRIFQTESIFIVKKAKKLYKLYCLNRVPKSLHERCCNFKLLEEKCHQWNLNKDHQIKHDHKSQGFSR